MSIPINERTTRTVRRWEPHSGTFMELLQRSQSVRCWLDNGQQKQSVRAIYSRAAPESQSGLSVLFTLRTPEGKHQQYENDSEDEVTWYEEV